MGKTNRQTGPASRELVHKFFGICKAVDGYVTSEHSKYITATCADGIDRMLLTEAQYWVSTPEEVSRLFVFLSSTHLKRVLNARARARRVELEYLKGADAAHARSQEEKFDALELQALEDLCIATGITEVDPNEESEPAALAAD